MTLLDRLPQLATGSLLGEALRRGDLPGLRDGLPTSVGAFAPAVDVEEGQDAFTLHVELPGVDAEDIEVHLDEDVLTISGERRFYDERDAEDFRRIERHFGRFHRAIRLPEGSDPEGVEARHRDGLLVLHVPKREGARPRRIEVQQAA